MLALTQAHALLIAERSRDIGVITEAVTDVLATNPYANLRDVEMVFRDGAAQAYVIAAGAEFRIVLGVQAWIAIAAAGMTATENRALLLSI
jgi:hypothetical protein